MHWPRRETSLLLIGEKWSQDPHQSNGITDLSIPCQGQFHATEGERDSLGSSEPSLLQVGQY